MKTILTVAGTHGYDDPWRRADSPLCRYLVAHAGCVVEDRYNWTTGLGGVGFGSSDLIVWQASGVQLHQFVVPPLCTCAGLVQRIAEENLILLTHSHGLQVALYALAAGLKADMLIDVCGPVRDDMMDVARMARQNVRKWVHIHGGSKDRWQIFGELFDGWWGPRRNHPQAHLNVNVPQADHNDVLEQPELFSIIADNILAPAGEVAGV